MNLKKENEKLREENEKLKKKIWKLENEKTAEYMTVVDNLEKSLKENEELNHQLLKYKRFIKKLDANIVLPSLYKLKSMMNNFEDLEK